MESWADGLSSRERVRKIALTITQPRSVNWIRREADVASWDTTKSELERLVELDQLKRVEDERGGETHYRYGPNYRRRYLDRIEELATEHSKDELRRELADIQEQIETWQSTYDVDDFDELTDSLSEEGLSSDEIRERNHVLGRWERAQSTRRLVNHALSLYEDLESVDDASSGSPPSRVTSP